MKRSEYEEYGISTWDDLDLLCYENGADDIGYMVYSKASYGDLLDDLIVNEARTTTWRNLYNWLCDIADVMDDDDGEYVIDDGSGLRIANEIDFESMVEEFVEYMDEHNLWEEEEEEEESAEDGEYDISVRKLFGLMVEDEEEKEEKERAAEERFELWLERHHP